MFEEENDPFKKNVDWLVTGLPEFPYNAVVENQKWIIQVNDFPEEFPYTLIINGIEIASFYWPSHWHRPKQS